MTFQPDLDAYFDRIRYAGSRAPTLATLNAIALHHVQAIPFENLDVLLQRGIHLDPPRVEEKLIYARRGGYCFEQNTHLLYVLLALGFDAAPISARVRVDRPRDFTPPRTHVFVRVELDGASWLVDAGVGGLSPTSALRLVEDEVQVTPHEPRRLVSEGNPPNERHSPQQPTFHREVNQRIIHQAFFAERWNDVCEFTLDAMPEIDREIGNWYTSTHPESRFKERLLVARATPTGRLTLLNRTFTRRERGHVETRILTSPPELLEVLDAEFGLMFPSDTRFRYPGLDSL